MLGQKAVHAVCCRTCIGRLPALLSDCCAREMAGDAVRRMTGRSAFQTSAGRASSGSRGETTPPLPLRWVPGRQPQLTLGVDWRPLSLVQIRLDAPRVQRANSQSGFPGHDPGVAFREDESKALDENGSVARSRPPASAIPSDKTQVACRVLPAFPSPGVSACAPCLPPTPARGSRHRPRRKAARHRRLSLLSVGWSLDPTSLSSLTTTALTEPRGPCARSYRNGRFGSNRRGGVPDPSSVARARPPYTVNGCVVQIRG